MYNEPRFMPVGDQALLMELGDDIEEGCNACIKGMIELIEEVGIKGIIETIPSYRSILIYYDPFVTDFNETVDRLKKIYGRLDIKSVEKGDTVIIPVLYGGEVGPDLQFVARYTGLTEEEVIDIHTSMDYLIYMLGFAPGFPYLGGIDERIQVPRLETPREWIPAGSVGIAGRQTGIYTVDSPGGWRVIGLTPVKLYDPHRDIPVILRIGDYIRFRPITVEEFDEIKKGVESGTYYPEVLRGGAG